MSPLSANQSIRAKTWELMKERRIKKVKLGEILSSQKEESPQQRFLRAQRFLNGTGDVKVQHLIKLVRFFKKPAQFFLPPNYQTVGLASPEAKKTNKEKTLEEIAASLSSLGFNENFINNQIAQIKAMDQYRSDEK